MENEERQPAETRMRPATESGTGVPAVIRDAAGHDYAELAKRVVEADTPEKLAEARRQQSGFWIEKLGLKPAYLDKTTGEARAGIYKKKSAPLQNFTSIRESGGYTFFFPDSENKAGDAIDLVEKPTREIIAAHKNKKDWEGIFKKHQDALLSEYKIHLQPKKEHIPTVVSRLIEMMEQHPEVTELVAGFKAKLGASEVAYDRPDGSKDVNQMAEIVLYPRSGDERLGNGKTRGRDSFEKVLAAVLDATKDLEGTANGKFPRGNAKINELVYAGQSGGDLKRVLKDGGVIDKLFDRDIGGQYAFTKGEKPPTPEELKTAKDALAARAAEIREEKAVAQKVVEDTVLKRAREGLDEIYEKDNLSAAPAETPPEPPRKASWLNKLFGRGK